MKNIIIFLFLISSLNCSADDWTESDTNREAAYMLMHSVDWAQTRNIARNPDKWYETNAILGKHPSVDRVDAYFVSTAILHYAVASALPVEYRSAFQYVWITIESGMVAHNLQFGVAVKF